MNQNERHRTLEKKHYAESEWRVVTNDEHNSQTSGMREGINSGLSRAKLPRKILKDTHKKEPLSR